MMSRSERISRSAGQHGSGGALVRDRRRCVISQRRFAAVGVLCGTVVLAAAVGLAGLGSPIVERFAASMKVSPPGAVSVDARTVDARQATTTDEDGVDAA